ncbi:MAG: hypothetical protein K2Y40_02425 [Reyranella sp.]|nr:hypothetical protein [Reyranella sp.]
MVRKPSKAAEAALYEAQDIAWDAWDAPDRPRRIALAKKALKVSPLCADAYAILAGEAKAGSDEQLELWRRGVAVGEEALGSKLFEEMAGHFWGILETRPYMRSRVGLAVALWQRGARDEAARNEAIGHLQAVLALNPNDNQGARYLLAGWLAQMERGDELEALLADAVEINRHVRAYLCGDRKVPRRKPPYYSPGAASEAMVYIEDHAAAWHGTAGALDWVRAQLPAPKKRAPRKADGKTLH